MDQLNLTAVLRLRPGEVLGSLVAPALLDTNGFYIGAPDSIHPDYKGQRGGDHLLTEVRVQFLLRRCVCAP